MKQIQALFQRRQDGGENLDLQHKIKGTSGNITDHKGKKIALSLVLTTIIKHLKILQSLGLTAASNISSKYNLVYLSILLLYFLSVVQALQ